MNEEASTLPSIDWRYRVATTIAKDCLSPAGRPLHKGDPVILTTYVKHGDLVIAMGDPSAPALFLSQSQKAFTQAMQAHPFLADAYVAPEQALSPIVNDYLEQVMASIVFAYTAIEAFANEEIPDDLMYQCENPRPASGLLVVYSKESIERRLSLDEKLARVLPMAKHVNTPKGLAVWEGYVQLRLLRDRIIHLKSSDRARSHGDVLFPDSIWTRLLDPHQPDYPVIAKKIIMHFCQEQAPHWLQNCPV